MRFTSAPRAPRPVLTTPARSPEDIMAYMVHALGYWPDASLVAVATAGGELGPCLRVDLPHPVQGAGGWAAGLREALGSLAGWAPGRPVTTFFAAFTECGSDAAPARLSCGTHPGGRPPAPEPSACAEGAWRCGDRVVLGLLGAAAAATASGIAVADLWVVDRAGNRWGRLPAPGPGERLSDAARAEGTVDAILASPVGAALTAEGHVLRGRLDAVREHPFLPGPYRTLEMTGEASAERVAERVRAAARLLYAVDRSERRAGRDLLPAVRRLEAALASWERHPCAGRGVAGIAPALASPPGGAARRAGAGWRVRCGWCWTTRDSRPPSSARPSGFLGRAFVGASGHAGTRGRCAGRGGAGQASSRGADGAAGVRVLRGRGGARPSVVRLAGLRVVLTALGEALGEPAASRAALGNAYISWFAGLNSQADLYLEQAGAPAVGAGRAGLRRRMAERPLPEWLAHPRRHLP
ncbi:DUF4192 domain-containing protein [Rothia sp. AR01]|uniref:DUF4192 domain-containing protein n=1 Tax=Rothia santali TaxID=2949643 RepID=A0A9X2HCE7_9MICC|nr:DUF4192 family protein [Rothia santali]MCP3425555.1 DUF4192 domain-containing protein [Rothia santali]